MKTVLKIFPVVLFLLTISMANASNVSSLKNIQVIKDGGIQLLLDREIQENDIKVEYIRDIIQVSLNNVTVYPAKMLSIDESNISKVFAYQYTPKLTRCRFTVKGSAESFKDRISVQRKGKLINIEFSKVVSSNDQVITQAATAVKVPTTPDDKVLLDRVLKGDKADKPTLKQEPKNLTAGKTTPSLWKSFFWTGVLIVCFFAFAIAFKKFKGKGLEKRLIGVFGKKGKMIEIVANHHLGPKKSIAVVRIKDRMLVVGITNESINLISEMSSDAEGIAEDATFSDELLKMGSGAQTAGKAVFSGGIRDQIKKRVEGMKNL